MGNNPSKSPPGDLQAPVPNSHHTSGHERKVNRRTSINALSGSKATAADPSASRESATGQAASHGQTTVQQRLQSRNVPHTVRRIQEMPETHATEKPEGQYHPSTTVEASSPMQVPSAPGRSAVRKDAPTTSGNPLNTYYGSSHLQRPPRLPLPIGDATATPGSPVMAPPDSQVDSVPFEIDNQVPRASIALDDTHIEDDELDDELQSYAMVGPGKAVPTVIEWKAAGDRVYVTGTFVNWEKKFRLHKRYGLSILPPL